MAEQDPLVERISGHIRERLSKDKNPERVSIVITRESWALILDALAAIPAPPAPDYGNPLERILRAERARAEAALAEVERLKARNAEMEERNDALTKIINDAIVAGVFDNAPFDLRMDARAALVHPQEQSDPGEPS